jgi:hypothetical protein
MMGVSSLHKAGGTSSLLNNQNEDITKEEVNHKRSVMARLRIKPEPDPESFHELADRIRDARRPAESILFDAIK